MPRVRSSRPAGSRSSTTRAAAGWPQIHVREGEHVAGRRRSWSRSTARSPAASAASSRAGCRCARSRWRGWRPRPRASRCWSRRRSTPHGRIWWRPSGRCSRRATPPTPAARRRWRRRCRPARGELRTAAAEVGRLRNSLAAAASSSARRSRRWPSAGSIPRSRWSQVERQYSDDVGELAKAEATLDAAKSALAEGREPAGGPGAPSGVRRCWPSWPPPRPTATGWPSSCAPRMRSSPGSSRHGAGRRASCRRSS